MVFELGGGWRPAEPLPDSLLQSIKDAAGGTPVVVPQLPDQPVLVSPLNNATEMPTDPVLTWNVSPQADFYSLQVSSDTAIRIVGNKCEWYSGHIIFREWSFAEYPLLLACKGTE